MTERGKIPSASPEQYRLAQSLTRSAFNSGVSSAANILRREARLDRWNGMKTTDALLLVAKLLEACITPVDVPINPCNDKPNLSGGGGHAGSDEGRETENGGSRGNNS